VHTSNNQSIHTLSTQSLATSGDKAQQVPRLVRQRGQGMTEYIIIVALVAVAAIAVYQYLGQVLRAQTAAVARELAGEDGTQQTRTAKTAAQGAKDQAKAKSLKSFTGNAGAAKR
jgi:type IV pilus assembly protein PilA